MCYIGDVGKPAPRKLNFVPPMNIESLTAKDRFLYALQIRKSLHSLMTESEADAYECIFEHFQDYINDLAQDIEIELPNLPQ